MKSAFSCLLASTVGAQSNYEGYQVPQYPFGATFPLTGTAAHNGNTWDGAVYYGTTMNFNPGAFVSYTDSYNVPVYPPPTPKPPTDNRPTFPTPHAPTMAPTEPIAGAYCTSFGAQCPFSYYCKVTPGYNPYQVGSCANAPSTYPISDGGDTYYGPVPDKTPDIDPGGSCAPPSACGYQSLSGTCWCDSACDLTGDCCTDRSTYQCDVGVLIPIYGDENNIVVEAPSFGSASKNRVCISSGVGMNCGSTQAFYEDGRQCFCDPVCRTWDDCCHDFEVVCGNGY